MTWSSGGPCRGGSDRLVAWQVAHCCLNSAAPSGDFAAGSDICAGTMSTVDIALQNPSPMANITDRFLMGAPLAPTELRSSRTSGGSSGLFYAGAKIFGGANAAVHRGS